MTVLSATEQCCQTRAETRPPVSYATGQPDVVQQNPPQRVRKRLARLGVPEAEIDAMLTAGGTPVATITPPGPHSSAARAALERIIGRNDLIGIEFLKAALTASGSVGHVLVKSRSGRVLGHGSGVLVSPRLFLTNNHVLGSAAEAATSAVEFGFEYERGGRLRQVRSHNFAPEDFFLTDSALDFSLVAVRNDEGLDEFGYVTLKDDDGAVLVGEYMNIVQHPNGQPKQIAFRDNQVTDLVDDFVHYRADTEPGSSGSPVFNDQWEMVALHHSGVPKKNTQGQIMARDGSVWTEDRGDFAIDWIANEGVRVGRILSRVREARLSDQQARLRDGLLSGVAVQRVDRPVDSSSAPPQATVTSTVSLVRPESGAIGRTTGAVTMTVPLQITLPLGIQPIGGTVAIPTETRTLPIAEGAFGSAYVPPPALNRFSVESLTAHDWNTRLSLALASHLAYADAETIESTARSLWGFETCEFVQANTTRCFIAATPDLVLISFRGTVDRGNWLSNLNVLSKSRPYGTVHRGFYVAFADMQGLLERRLDDFPNRPILLTGHSLGGALAGIAAAEWQGARSVKAIYTYGQPAVGTSGYRDFIGTHYADSYFRFVNEDDIVPRVPPGYKHVGHLVHFG